VFPVAAVAAAGWLLLFIVLLAAPPSPQARRGVPGDDQARYPGDEPPAVVSLLAGQLGRLGFGATLVDLAIRGWFQVSGSAGPAGQAPAGPAMCVVPAEAPAGPLAPFERRVVAHVALRAGARGEVPAPALSDGFESGEAEFMTAFHGEVDADARQRGLTRSRLSPGRIALLCVLLLVPAGAVLLASDAAHRKDALAYLGVSYFVLSGFTIKIGTSRRCSAAGRAALERWRAAATAPGGDRRLLAYAAALGAAPAAVAVFAPAGKDVVWSSYRGSWQQIVVEKNTWPWPQAIALVLAIIVAPVLYFWGVFWLFAQGMTGLAERAIGLAVAGVVGFAAWMAGRTLIPRFTEFDGQVIRQTFVKGGDESPDEYHVVIDDGVRDTAWDFKVGSESYRRLAPGTFVHVRVNLRSKEQVTVEPVEPPAVVRQLAEIAAEQQRAATGGLPDPAGLVTAEEAAGVLGRPVVGQHSGSPARRMMTWQPTGTGQPILRIIVSQAGEPLGRRPMPQAARPVPGVAGGYLLDKSALLYVGPLSTVISISGKAPAGIEASLIGLMQLVEARLGELAARPEPESGYRG
jgi:hypothetical protein